MRLLSLVAELGKAAVHEIAARLGLDPREAASRLIALSGTGLPLIVGVECDPQGLRNAIAGAGAWMNYAAQGGAQGTPSGSYPVPAPARYGPPGQAYGTPSGQYAAPQRGYGQPSGPYPPPRPPMPPPGPPQGPPAQPQAAQPQAAPQQAPQAQSRLGPPSTPFPAPGADPISTWGPPQSSSWARGDAPTRPAYPNQPARPPGSAGSSGGGQRGTVGDTLTTDAVEGGQVAIQLVEVVDPADFLFSAAGYRLREGERAVVVHTELSNRGTAPFPTLPDLYLLLVAADGQTVSKAPVSLSSRPPHRIGVQPGETAGGHTVYVLPETTKITSVRWSPRPDDEQHVLTWTVED